ncbi:MAG: YtxH domain-containing protein [Myxococcaceae bacterium]|jgi:hypothetical protein|nr:YtxH domain-containing protein [Myxococcaceae bacterium]MCA3013735.1 YtxH domain-containing protein [Myxococcaceae bacterium]
MSTAGTVLKTLRKLGDVDKDDVLDLIGLEERRSTSDKLVPALALFGAGVLVGVGVGLLLAPRPGRQLRDEVKAKLGRGQAAGASNGQHAAAPKTV